MRKLFALAGILVGLMLAGPVMAGQPPTPDQVKKFQDDLQRLQQLVDKQAAQIKADADAKSKAEADKVDKAKEALKGPAQEPKLKLANPANGPPAAGPDPKFKTGARLTPVAKILEAIRTGKASIHHATRDLLPATVTRNPPTRSMLGNDRYGCCVTSESCAAIEADSFAVTGKEIVIPDSSAVAWASAHGVLNGADLLSVMQDMQKDPVKDSTGKGWTTGVPSNVDYNDEATLQSAIALGPVSIAIGSGDLSSGAGNADGWYSLTARGAPNDHDVGLWGYGRAEDLYKVLNMACPAACAGKTGYLCYTWSTIGFVTHAWVMGTVQEAWVRQPTVVGLQPTPPPVQPITVAVGDVSGTVGKATTFFPIVTGGTPPYFAYNYDYGDGSPKDGTGSHVYAVAGSFKVTVTVTDAQSKVGSGTCIATVTQVPIPVPSAGKIVVTKDSVTFPLNLPPGTYIPVQEQTLQRTLGELLNQNTPTPGLTPAEKDLLQQLIDRFKSKTSEMRGVEPVLPASEHARIQAECMAVIRAETKAGLLGPGVFPKR